MMIKEPNTSTKDNPLVRALARWENEGGRTDTDWEKRAALIQEEERILHCLGAAVIMNWNFAHGGPTGTFRERCLGQRPAPHG